MDGGDGTVTLPTPPALVLNRIPIGVSGGDNGSTYSSSVVSSDESEHEPQQQQQQQQQQQRRQQQKDKKRRTSTDNSDVDPFASLINPPPTAHRAASPKPSEQTKPENKKMKTEPTPIHQSPIPPQQPTEPPSPSPYPIPHSTPEGLHWQAACLATRAHPRYASSYNFKKKQDISRRYRNATWISAEPYGPWCAGNPHAIAINFEVCETKCGVTGKLNPKALCRMMVLNAVDGEVLLDTLVKPDWPVIHYRSKINGIEKEHLNDVKFTMKHAQAFMLALCSSETVIIGHAQHSDLRAIQMTHHCNVDSAYLFTLDEPNSKVGLRDISMSVLQREMSITHDSVNDARVALLCIEEGYLKKVAQGQVAEPIVRSYTTRDWSGRLELFVYGIPRACNGSHIEGMILNHTSIRPTKVADVERKTSGAHGTALVTFSSVEHAQLAFKVLKGDAVEDKKGRLQKKVFMKNGGYVNVRMMTLE